MYAHRRIFKSAANDNTVRYIAPKMAHVFIYVHIIINRMVERCSDGELVFDKNRPLEKVFGNCNARVLDFFILNQGLDYSASELSTITDIPLRSVQRSLPHLVKCRLIREAYKVGNSRTYVLDEGSELARVLTQYVDTSINTDIKYVKTAHSDSDVNKVISIKRS